MSTLRNWPIKFKLISVANSALLIFLLWVVASGMHEGQWRETIHLLSLAFMLPLFIFAPEIFFMPIVLGSNAILSTIKQNRFIGILTYVGLALLWLGIILELLDFMF